MGLVRFGRHDPSLCREVLHSLYPACEYSQPDQSDKSAAPGLNEYVERRKSVLGRWGGVSNCMPYFGG